MYVMMIDIDAHGHRKAIVIKVGSGVYVAVVDAVPQTLERSRYDETIPLNTIDIVRRRLTTGNACKGEGYSYTVLEEAVCLKRVEECTIFSYIAHIVCEEGGTCNDSNIIDLVKCLASKY